MAKVITFSRFFPAYHPKKNQPTYFVEKVSFDLHTRNELPIEFVQSLSKVHFDDSKHHTIRAGHRFKAGDYFSPRVWSGKPYRSKQIVIAPDTEIKKVFDFEIRITDDFKYSHILLNGAMQDKFLAEQIAKNDGLEYMDFLAWFEYPKSFDGQILCWNENIEY